MKTNEKIPMDDRLKLSECLKKINIENELHYKLKNFINETIQILENTNV